MAVSSERITRALELAYKMDVCEAGRAALLDLLMDSLSLQQTQALRILAQAGRDWTLPGTIREQMGWQALCEGEASRCETERSRKQIARPQRQLP